MEAATSAQHREGLPAQHTILRTDSPSRRIGRRSAGLLMYRRRCGTLEVLLVHPGGPLWAGRDLGAWSIPKGEMNDASEDPLDTAKREFAEETGFAPGTQWIGLGEVRQRSGKRVTAWAFEGDADPAALVSNAFEMEWPPKSGTLQSFPEIDRAEWFPVDLALEKIFPDQRDFLSQLLAKL